MAAANQPLHHHFLLPTSFGLVASIATAFELPCYTNSMDFEYQFIAKAKPSIVVIEALSIVAARGSTAADRAAQTATVIARIGQASDQGLLARLMMTSDLDFGPGLVLADWPNSEVGFA